MIRFWKQNVALNRVSDHETALKTERRGRKAWMDFWQSGRSQRSHGMKRKQTQWERLEQCGNLGAVRVHGESRKTLPTESALSYAYWNSFILQRSSYLPTNSNTTATDPRTPLCTVGPWRYKMRDGGPRNSNLQNLGSIVEFSGNWEPILIIP
eukprot:3108829-Rhodomonas_salina.4